MLFNSLAFVAFLGLVYGAWRALPLGAGRYWLLAASCVFYGWWDWRFLGLLLATATLDWALALGMERWPDRRKALVTVSVVSNLGTLAVFKYAGFFSRELAAALGLASPSLLLDIVLPVGISFYTFQAMAYTIDVYRGRVAPCRKLLDFLLFITFFPQLVAGPIERSSHLLPQLLQMRRPASREHSEAMWLITWGYVKKVVVADNLAPIVAAGFDKDGPGGAAVLLAAYAFTWQIYCDFSGYSDIARGVARLFGVDLMENFARPFFAASPREVWHRWHVSLSQWLRDYLYLPLGGNRSRPGFNLMATMVLGGLWHGANYTYLAWGAWHGGALALGRRLPRPKIPRWLLVVATFHLTCLGFVVFRAHSLAHLVEMASSLSSLQLTPTALAHLRTLLWLAVPVTLLEWVQERQGTLAVLGWPRSAQACVYALLWTSILVLGSSYGYQFIYFQF
ncbi:MAG: MBOAT family protein [Deltaproteobacteria bacterium]|nr:MBOAT family protein [Deltaproteobacteria bacterium]